MAYIMKFLAAMGWLQYGNVAIAAVTGESEVMQRGAGLTVGSAKCILANPLPSSSWLARPVKFRCSITMK